MEALHTTRLRALNGLLAEHPERMVWFDGTDWHLSSYRRTGNTLHVTIEDVDPPIVLALPERTAHLTATAATLEALACDLEAGRHEIPQEDPPEDGHVTGDETTASDKERQADATGCAVMPYGWADEALVLVVRDLLYDSVRTHRIALSPDTLMRIEGLLSYEGHQEAVLHLERLLGHILDLADSDVNSADPAVLISRQASAALAPMWWFGPTAVTGATAEHPPAPDETAHPRPAHHTPTAAAVLAALAENGPYAVIEAPRMDTAPQHLLAMLAADGLVPGFTSGCIATGEHGPAVVAVDPATGTTVRRLAAAFTWAEALHWAKIALTDDGPDVNAT